MTTPTELITTTTTGVYEEMGAWPVRRPLLYLALAEKSRKKPPKEGCHAHSPRRLLGAVLLEAVCEAAPEATAALYTGLGRFL